MTNKKTLEQYSLIFDSFEKWDALWKIYDETDSLIEPWLETGAACLREIYNANPEEGWSCQEWGLRRDTRWFLNAHGENSAGFGIGWNDFELHFHLNRSEKDEYEVATSLLDSSEFGVIKARFPRRPGNKKCTEGSLAWDPSFNPYGDASNKKQMIAWRAHHESQEFAKRMLDNVRSIMRDITGALNDFNLRLRAR